MSGREWIVKPDPEADGLSQEVDGTDHEGNQVSSKVVSERSVTLFLNRQEIVTLMTVGDHLELLALGFLLNQNMLKPEDEVIGIDFDSELDVIVVRTSGETDFEALTRKRIRTSGCAQGTAFGDVMDRFDEITLPKQARLKTSWLYELTRKINTVPSLYLAAGAIHGCVLCERNLPLAYMEDVGRHNAVDKIAGWMFRNRIEPHDKIFYTTGRLTSEMVIKTALMGIPILVSRSGFTSWGVELARRVNLTLIGRARGKRFLALSGAERIEFDSDPDSQPEESFRHRRKGALGDD